MSKQKRMKRLIFVLVALLLVYFVTSQYFGWKEEQEQETETQKLSVTNLDEEEILGITYTNGQETMEFELIDDSWIYDNNENFPLRQSYMSEIIGECKQLVAVRSIEEPEAAEEYGLDDPTYTVILTDAEGRATTVKYGKLTANYNYYVSADDGEGVFEIDSTLLDLFAFEENDLLEHDVFPAISSSNLVALTVEQDERTLIECKSDEDSADDQDDELSDYGADLSTISLETCVDYYVKEKELSTYGLSETKRKKITAVYSDDDTGEDEEVTFYMSEPDDEDYVYIQMDNSQLIYKVEVTEMEKLI